MTRTWLDAAREYGAAHGVLDSVLDALPAFAAIDPRGGPPPPLEQPCPGSFGSFAREQPDPEEGAAAITELLAEDIDRPQAAMLVRRIMAVDRLLAERGDPAGLVLGAGLRHRLAGVLGHADRRVLRVRALADFYWSVASRERWRGTLAPTLRARVAALEWRVVSPGLSHGRIAGPTADGPAHINVLRVDPRLLAIRVVDARELDGAGSSLVEIVERYGAAAAISGGFFLYSEPNIRPPERRHDPVGLLLSGGHVRSLPALRRGCLLARPGAVGIGPGGLDGLALEVGPVVVRPTAGRITTRAQRAVGPDEPSVALLADRVLAVGKSLDVPLTGCVITAAHPRELDGIVVGARVRCAAPLLDDAPASDGLAGGPVLLRDGAPAIDMRAEDFWGTAPPVTFSQDETGDQNLLPRMGVGVDAQGRLLCAAVDGRNEQALGMTLVGLGELMAVLGCSDALNLDGGSSKRMCVGREIVDLPTTEVARTGAAPRVRPVYSAVVFAAR